MATGNESGGGWGWGVAGALVGAVGVGLLVSASADREREVLTRELGAQGARHRALHEVYLRGKKVSREELGALWSAPTWQNVSGTSRAELQPERFFLDGSSAAYDAESGELVAVYGDPTRGSYFVRPNTGRR